jgi:phenylglyoxylate dehydrogenase epsilon subunit
MNEMPDTKYLILGSSHAGLAALDTIRLLDPEGKVTMVTKDTAPPYSPTVLPYVFSGRTEPDQVFLRTPDELAAQGVEFITGAAAARFEPEAGKAVLEDGREISYRKALVATGARPAVPSIQGLDQCPYRVLRTLDDAVALKDGAGRAGSAVILGAGLIGLHAAEALAAAGLEVTVVEMQNQVLPGYFDKKAAGMIAEVFEERGVKLLLGSEVTHVTSNHNGCGVSLAKGVDLSADLLLVAAGVRPNWECLGDQQVVKDQGVVVDEHMRTGLPDVWAAGDVAQAKGFFESSPQYMATLPMAVEQGRVAGADMAGDPEAKPFAGALAMNTFSFFGHRAFSVGKAQPMSSTKTLEVDVLHSPASQRYQKLVFKNGVLVGAAGVNSELDPGVLWQLIRRRVPLEGAKEDFAARPLETGRLLMTQMWR